MDTAVSILVCLKHLGRGAPLRELEDGSQMGKETICSDRTHFYQRRQNHIRIELSQSTTEQRRDGKYSLSVRGRPVPRMYRIRRRHENRVEKLTRCVQGAVLEQNG